MFSETRKRFDWFSLIVGILFIVGGIFSFMHPDTTLRTLAIIVGIVFIVRGVYSLWFRNFASAVLDRSSVWVLISAIIDIIAGLIVLFRPGVGIVFIAIMFAIWFIFDSAIDIATAGAFKQFSRGYSVWLIILSILGIILGIILLFSPMLSAMTIVWLLSAYLLTFGIIKVIQAF